MLVACDAHQNLNNQKCDFFYLFVGCQVIFFFSLNVSIHDYQWNLTTFNTF